MKRRKFHIPQKKVPVLFDHYESLLLQLAMDEARSSKKDTTVEEIVKGAVRFSLGPLYDNEVAAILKRSQEDMEKKLP
jgi:hypothetical protein